MTALHSSLKSASKVQKAPVNFVYAGYLVLRSLQPREWLKQAGRAWDCKRQRKKSSAAPRSNRQHAALFETGFCDCLLRLYDSSLTLKRHQVLILSYTSDRVKQPLD